MPPCTSKSALPAKTILLLGATGKVGNIYGTATGKVTGTTTYGGSIGLSSVYGITDESLEVATAGATYTTVAGAGTVGKMSGTATGTVNGTSNAKTASGSVYATSVSGVEDVTMFVSRAYSYENFKGSTAKGGAGAVGDISGTTTSTVTGNTTTGTVSTKLTYGISDITVEVSGAYSYLTSTAGAGTVGNISGKATASTTGTTTGDPAPVYSTKTRGFTDFDIFAGVASASTTNAKSVATGGTATIGNVYGNASTTVNATTTGKSASVYANFVTGVYDGTFNAGYAAGYTATSGVGTIAASAGITGFGTATVTANTKGTLASVSAGNGPDAEIFGIFNIDAYAGNAVASSNYKLNQATSLGGTIGLFNGRATATITETGTALYDSYASAYGIYDMTARVGAASGTAAKAGASAIGNIYGLASATAGSAVGLYHSTAEAHGIQNTSFSAGRASSGYTGKTGIATGGASTIGTITGKGYATATTSQTLKAAKTQYARAYGSGILDNTFADGTANADYKAYGAASSIGATTGIGAGTASGYQAEASSGAVVELSLDAANSYGGTIAKSVSNAAAGTIGAIYGKSTATATAPVVPGTSFGHAYSLGLDEMGATAGLAEGYNPNAGANSAVGKITGTATAAGTGLYAVAHAYGIDSVFARSADAYGTGKLTAATGSVGAGTGIYGTATATATSNYAKANKGTAAANADGIEYSYISAGSAYGSRFSVNSNAYGGAGTVGNLSGKAVAKATDTAGRVWHGLRLRRGQLPRRALAVLQAAPHCGGLRGRLRQGLRRHRHGWRSHWLRQGRCLRCLHDRQGHRRWFGQCA